MYLRFIRSHAVYVLILGTRTQNCSSIWPHPTTCKLFFPGDTLFIGGCGRFFEGTAEQMYSALVEKLGNLPGNTRVFCGHEYTVQNLKFAQHVERDNHDVLEKIQWANQKRLASQPTVRCLFKCCLITCNFFGT